MISLRDMVDKYLDVIDHYPNFKKHVFTLKLCISQLQNPTIQPPTQPAPKETKQVNQYNLHRISLVTAASQQSEKLVEFAIKSKNKALAESLHFSRGQLLRSHHNLLQDRALYLYNQAQIRLQNLVQFGISKESQNEFQRALINFSKAEPPIKVAKERPIKKPKTKKKPQINYLVEGLKTMSKMDFDALRIALEHPEFYSEWTRVRNFSQDPRNIKEKVEKKSIKKPKVEEGKSLLTITISDIYGLSVSNVELKITDTKAEPDTWIIRKVVKTGTYLTKTLPKGNYLATVFKTGYKLKEIHFPIHTNTSLDLTIEMELD